MLCETPKERPKTELFGNKKICWKNTQPIENALKSNVFVFVPQHIEKQRINFQFYRETKYEISSFIEQSQLEMIL